MKDGTNKIRVVWVYREKREVYCGTPAWNTYQEDCQKSGRYSYITLAFLRVDALKRQQMIIPAANLLTP